MKTHLTSNEALTYLGDVYGIYIQLGSLNKYFREHYQSFTNEYGVRTWAIEDVDHYGSTYPGERVARNIDPNFTKNACPGSHREDHHKNLKRRDLRKAIRLINDKKRG